MTNGPDLGWIASYIWGIADDVLRDVYVRGKYRDVILPMTVLRRLDAVLEPTKQAVLDMKAALDSIGVVNQKTALRRASRGGLLQHLGVQPEGSPGQGQPPAAHGRLRGLPRRILPQRPGHPRQLRVPQPDLGGIEGFLQREVMPWVPDAWYNQKTVKTGYEISFNRYFYKPKPMRTLEEIRAEIRAVEREAAGLLEGVLH